MSFFNELKRRNVFRVGAAYLVVAWLVVQVVGELGDIFSLSDAIGQTVVILLAIGFPIAIAGTAGYIFNGWGVANLPPLSLGYVYLPGVFGIACASVLTAPLGVRLAHRLPMGQLKRVFALLLLLPMFRRALPGYRPETS